MKTALRIDKITTELPPCALRIHPKLHNVIFIGTYKLEKESGLRHGSIDIYDLSLGKMTKRHSIPTSLAVLDLKFSTDALVLVLAHSTGNLDIWTYNGNILERTKSLQLFDTLVLITSVFCSPHFKNQVLVTATTGESALVDLETGIRDDFSTSHTLECWTGAFGEVGPSSHVVFTGGDDAKLIAHDIRTRDKIWETSHRHHDAGVVLVLCPGQWRSTQPDMIWTGSYDDCLRVFDLRYIDGDNGPELYPGFLPQEKNKLNLNGGVWRLIPASDSDQVLACCMYDGARIIDPDKPSVNRYFKGDHESMCYGGDWQGDMLATCSFYDNVVQTWLPTAVETSSDE